MSVIQIENLKYRYPGLKDLVLNDISLSIEKGEFVGIIGRNGAGKSTLSQAIIGLVPQFYKGAYGGKVSVNGVIAKDTPVNQMCKHVGLVFQNPFNQLSGAKETVYEEVAFGMENLGVDPDEMKVRIENCLKTLDIWQYRDRNPFDLSGGQMQRVAIASVMVMQPDVIIFDEPTSQLDPQGSEDVFRAVEEMTRLGITIIMIEQKMEKLAKYCDRLILMDKGTVVDFDTPEKIFSRPDLEEYGIEPPAAIRYAKKIEAKDSKAAGLESKDSKAADSGEEIVIEARNIDFSYLENVPVLENLNLTLTRKPTAIIGQNGAGKTTLVRLLKGLLKPLAGNILLYGEDISGVTVAKLAPKVGYVFQNPDDQIFKYKVIDEIMFGPLQIGMDEETAREKAMKALSMVGLLGKEAENPYDLELYERKMIAIASVLAMDTDVIILDEPTIAQDYPGRKQIGEIIRQVTSEGKLLVAILHDMEFVAEYFDRAIVMAHGKILFDGTPNQVFMQDDILKEAKLEKPTLYLGTVLLQRG